LIDRIHRAFEGSMKNLIMLALSTGKPSRKNLNVIEKLLDKYEGDSK
jgi:hypothetical protein